MLEKMCTYHKVTHPIDAFGKYSRSIDVKKLAVHHNHNTGKIIALCCAECNMGMGKLKDNSTFLKRAADLMNEEGS